MAETLEESIVRLLRESNRTVTFVESCTGGLLSATLLDAPGASGVYRQGYITYCDEAKHSMVGVKIATLEKYTAVSAKTAEEMAFGGAGAAKAQACVSVTGIAGPGGGTPEKPVGLVYIGCFLDGEVKAYEFRFAGSRREIREQAVTAALNILKERLLEGDMV